MRLSKNHDLVSRLLALPLVLWGVVLWSTIGMAQDAGTIRALTFQNWKDQQVSEAQNQIAHSTQKLKQAKRGRTHTKATPDVPGSGFVKKVGEGESVNAAEQDLKRAQDALAEANQLKFENYVEVYVSNLRDRPEVLQKLSERLSKDELVEILKFLMRKPVSPVIGDGASLDATRNGFLAGGTLSTLHTKIH